MSRGIGAKFDKWLDECKLALEGVILSTTDWRFWAGFFSSFIIFGTLLQLLNGAVSWNLFWNVNLPQRMHFVGEAFLGIFGIGHNFWDWLLSFVITLIQSILIGLVVLVWRHKKHHSSSSALGTAINTQNASDAGIAAGLALLGSGCPTCGTTLLAPILGAIMSAGGYAVASVISGLFTAASLLLALWALKRVGKDVYALIISDRFQKKRGNNGTK